MANTQRGEVVLPAGDKNIRLNMTLGAMAEIEDAFQLESIQALAQRLNKPKVNDLLVILSALSMGGGEQVSVDELRRLPINLNDAKTAIEEVLKAATPEDEEDDTADKKAEEPDASEGR